MKSWSNDVYTECGGEYTVVHHLQRGSNLHGYSLHTFNIPLINTAALSYGVVVEWCSPRRRCFVAPAGAREANALTLHAAIRLIEADPTSSGGDLSDLWLDVVQSSITRGVILLHRLRHVCLQTEIPARFHAGKKNLNKVNYSYLSLLTHNVLLP